MIIMIYKKNLASTLDILALVIFSLFFKAAHIPEKVSAIINTTVVINIGTIPVKKTIMPPVK